MAAGSELIRQVVVRDFPGRERDDAFVSTNVNQAAAAIIEELSERWSLEVTFHEAKGKLGFEAPRIELSVRSSAPRSGIRELQSYRDWVRPIRTAKPSCKSNDNTWVPPEGRCLLQ